MKKTKGFLLAVAAAAMAFSFSCSSDDEKGGGGDDSSSSSDGTVQGGGDVSSSSSDGTVQSSSSIEQPIELSSSSSEESIEVSSSSIGSVEPSSPSIAPSSSSVSAVPLCGSVEYDPETEYCSNGTKQDYIFRDYEGKTYKAVVIGGLTWMAENLNYEVEGSKCYNGLESNCDKYGRLYDWETATEVCPAGWRLPSGEDWSSLITYMGGEDNARKLMAKNSGWVFLHATMGAIDLGEDEYGFSALQSLGEYNKAYWQSSKTQENNNAYLFNIQLNTGTGKANINTIGNKSSLHSVRCVTNDPNNIPDITSNTVTIGTQTWMRKDLDNSKLYDWATAMALGETCNVSICAIQSKHRGICPEGFHIPSKEEWNVLINEVGDTLTAGKHLKALSGWKYGVENLDTYKFSALPSGYIQSSGSVRLYGEHGFWWSATPPDGGSTIRASNAHHLYMSYNNDKAGIDYNYNSKFNKYSVRCLQD